MSDRYNASLLGKLGPSGLTGDGFDATHYGAANGPHVHATDAVRDAEKTLERLERAHGNARMLEAIDEFASEFAGKHGGAEFDWRAQAYFASRVIAANRERWAAFDDGDMHEAMAFSYAMGTAHQALLVLQYEARLNAGKSIKRAAQAGHQLTHGTKADRQQHYQQIRSRIEQLRSDHPEWSARSLDRQVASEFGRSERHVQQIRTGKK